MVQIGDEILAKLPLYTNGHEEDAPLVRGRVIWVHPQQRFFKGQFHLPGGREVTECFSIVNGEPFGAVPLERKKRRR